MTQNPASKDSDNLKITSVVKKEQTKQDLEKTAILHENDNQNTVSLKCYW